MMIGTLGGGIAGITITKAANVSQKNGITTDVHTFQ
jgi:hypothetical protein